MVSAGLGVLRWYWVVGGGIGWSSWSEVVLDDIGGLRWEWPTMLNLATCDTESHSICSIFKIVKIVNPTLYLTRSHMIYTLSSKF